MSESATLKLTRARQHIRDFNSIMSVFINRQPYGLLFDGRYSQVFYGFALLQPIPAEALLVAGDALHNLRAALDHCVCALGNPQNKALSNAQRKDLNFPISHFHRQDFEKILDNNRFLLPSIKSLLRKQEVYPGGSGAPLIALHDLDITDKHTLLVPMGANVKLSGLIMEQILLDGTVRATELLPCEFELLITDKTTVHGKSYYGFQSLGSFDKGRYGRKLKVGSQPTVKLDISFRHKLFVNSIGPLSLGNLESLVSRFLAEARLVQHSISNKSNLDQRGILSQGGS